MAQQRYMMTVEYDGSGYSGWQIQANAPSIQGELESALANLLQREHRVHGAGRTDSGVHALAMTAHFDTESAMPNAEIRKALNALLPPDIAVHSLEPVPGDFHSRFSASSRTYRYTISRRKCAIGRQFAWQHYGAFDLKPMKQAAECLAGTHDFAGLSKRTPGLDHTLCHVFRAEWSESEFECRFEIKANRFLYGMVRTIVGGLMQVGRGVVTPEAFKARVESAVPENAPMLAPACGLTLLEVGYDKGDWDTVQAIMDALRLERNGDTEDE